MPKSNNKVPTTSCSMATGIDASASPKTATRAASRPSAPTVPSNAERHPRTTPTARTTVNASTASTDEARKALAMVDQACIGPIIGGPSRVGSSTASCRPSGYRRHTPSRFSFGKSPIVSNGVVRAISRTDGCITVAMGGTRVRRTHRKTLHRNTQTILRCRSPGRWRQHASQALRDVLALQGLAQDFPDPDRARTLIQLPTAVAAHQNDRDIGPPQANLTGEIGADQLGHRLIGQDDVKALRRFAECLQCHRAGTEPDGLVTELGQHFFGERNQWFLIVDDHDRLASAVRQLGGDSSRRDRGFTRNW